MTVAAPIIQPIVLRERLLAVLIDGEAFINVEIDPGEQATVKAMCLFAMEIQTGDIEGPYTETRALAYAARAAGTRQAARRTRGPGRLG